MDLKVFIHTDADIRLKRRLLRDVKLRGRTCEGVLKSYNRFVKKSFDEFIVGTMKHATVIIPNTTFNP